jgi:hypothetical protein
MNTYIRGAIARMVFSLGVLVATSAPAAAQQAPSSLALLIQEMFGPQGLFVNSEQLLPDGSTHSAHFNSAFQSNFKQFNIALASQLTTIPLPSPASGFTYRFDTETGTFVRSTQSFGPILADRAETIGKGRFAVAFNQQFITFDALEGVDLRRLPAVFIHDDRQLGGGRNDVVAMTSAIKASVAQFTGMMTYGVTDRFDVSLAVPVVRTRLGVTALATIDRVGTAGSPAVHFFHDDIAPGGFGSQKQFVTEGTASGVGDVIVRAKATTLREGRRALSAAIDVRLPTGDENDLLGSGAWGVKPLVAFSWSHGRVSPHVNLGYQWNSSSVLAGDLTSGVKADMPDRFLYALGADIGVDERLSLAIDVLGEHVFDSPRLHQTRFIANPDNPSVTLPDITFEHGSFSTLRGAFGIKTNVVGNVLVNFNLRFNFLEHGLTERLTPLIGLEYSF